MMNKIFYVLVPAYLSMSVAVADPSQEAGPVLLSQNDMDRITAGFSASGDAGAVGISPIFSYTNTDSAAITLVTTTDNPVLGTYAAISGGEAQAVAVGSGASTDTFTSSSNTISGPNVHTAEINIQGKGVLGEGSLSIVFTIGSLNYIPF